MSGEGALSALSPVAETVAMATVRPSTGQQARFDACPDRDGDESVVGLRVRAAAPGLRVVGDDDRWGVAAGAEGAVSRRPGGSPRGRPARLLAGWAGSAVPSFVGSIAVVTGVPPAWRPCAASWRASPPVRPLGKHPYASRRTRVSSASRMVVIIDPPVAVRRLGERSGSRASPFQGYRDVSLSAIPVAHRPIKQTRSFLCVPLLISCRYIYESGSGELLRLVTGW